MTAYVLLAAACDAVSLWLMNAIDVRNIVKRFGDFTAVNGVSFAVEKGRCSACSGPTARASRR